MTCACAMKALFASILVLCLSGCSVAAGDLPGQYVAEFGFAHEQLELLANGKYRQTITVSGMQGETVHDGTWFYHAAYSEVVLDAPLLVSDLSGRFNGDYQTPADGTWNLTVRRWRGKLTLNWDDDAGVQFRKVR